VKAHRTETDDMSIDEKIDVRGNSASDEAAKEAVRRHPQRSREQEEAVEYYCKRAPLVVKAVATALALFPPVGERMKRPPPPRTVQQAIDNKSHYWRFEEGTWRCEVCATWVASHRIQEKKRREKCAGPHLDDRARDVEGLGHRLCRTRGSIPIVFCSRCGAWSSRRPRKLKSPCKQATAPGTQALARLAKGQRPWIKREEGGGGICQEGLGWHGGGLRWR
jgi:hypothetical protein